MRDFLKEEWDILLAIAVGIGGLIIIFRFLSLLSLIVGGVIFAGATAHVIVRTRMQF